MERAKTDGGQDQVVRFLMDPGVHGVEAGSVAKIETHGAIVFLVSDHAYKMKKSVRFPYMDFSTLELRHQACRREIELNQPNAPDLYLGLIPVRSGPSGTLSLDGTGEIVEWLVHMRRFADDALLSCIAQCDQLDPKMAIELADIVEKSHRSAPQTRSGKAKAGIERTIASVVDGLRSAASPQDQALIAELDGRFRGLLAKVEKVVQRRSDAGFVRRCHGDLHLGNIMLWQGRPTLFDALEFDDEIATIDTLYDLAFLLMDLDERGERATACLVLNRYLWRSGTRLDLEGLSALPLFMGLRASIRAMVLLQRAVQSRDRSDGVSLQCARKYLDAALAYTAPAAPRLVAVGGLSGTGKSTLAAKISSRLDPAPGAVHLRSDLERKAIAGIEETTRLTAERYTQAARLLVYERLFDRATAALSAGHSVVVDAVFVNADERRKMQGIAAKCGVRFDGIWLSAPLEILVARVSSRIGDASDADAVVVRRQSAEIAAAAEWTGLDASGTPDSVAEAAAAALGIELAAVVLSPL